MQQKQIHKIFKDILYVLIISLPFIGCQKEYADIKKPDKSITISKEDSIAYLILDVTLKDGSYDNIIDRCSEISINYPYALFIDDKFFYITSLEDIEAIKYDYFNYRDDIEIKYPITVTFSNYTEKLVSNEDELEVIQEQYNKSLIDDDIECLDFVYPIEMSIYDDTKQSLEVVVANNDFEMYSIFQKINDLLLDITFPIELKLLNGDTITAINNIQLEEEIENTLNSCNEHDEVEFEDNDYPYIEILTKQEWIVNLFSDQSNQTIQFDTYVFLFKKENSTIGSNELESFSGSWELDLSDSLKYLSIEYDTDITPLVWLNADWKIKNITSEIIEMEAESDFDGYIKKLTLQKRNLN